MLKRSFTLAEESNQKKSKFANLIRLGEAFKYAGQYEVALKSFDTTIRALTPIDDCDLLDFALQHKGKCLMELGKWELALSHFLQALFIRKSKGEPSLIYSTELSIQFIKEKNDNL